MNLRSMKLTDFRSYASAELADLGRMNVIGGLNGSGKSTLLDALAVALTGTCRGAEAGRGLDELRRTGGRKWQIELAIETKPGEIERIRRNEGEGPRSATQDHVDGLLGMSGARARACLYSGELLRLAPKEAQRLILDLCDPGVEVPDRVRDLVRKHLGAGLISPGAVSMQVIDDLYKAAFSARTEAGRDMKAHSAAAPAIPQGLEQLSGKRLPEIEEIRKGTIERRLAELGKERDAYVRERAGLIAAGQRLAVQVAERQKAIEDAQAEFKGLPEDATAELMRLNDRLDSIVAASQEGVAAREALRNQVSEARARARAAQAAVESVAGVKAGKCPTCHSAVSAAQVKKLRDPLLKEKDEATKALSEIERRWEAIPQDAEDPAPLRREIARLESSGKRRDELAATIRKNDTELQNLRMDLARESAAAGEKDSEIEGKIAALDGRIAEGQGKLKLVVEYEGALKAAGEAQAWGDRAAAKHADLEWLVGELGPKGPLRAQAAGGTAEFQEKVGAHLAEFGFSADFGPLLDATGDPLVNGRPARLLSSSEAMRFGIAFQVAIAGWSGLGIVAVDDWERFDGASLRTAQKILAESGQQVFIFTVVRDADEFRKKAARAGGHFYLAAGSDEGSVLEQIASAEVAA